MFYVFFSSLNAFLFLLCFFYFFKNAFVLFNVMFFFVSVKSLE